MEVASEVLGSQQQSLRGLADSFQFTQMMVAVEPIGWHCNISL